MTPLVPHCSAMEEILDWIPAPALLSAGVTFFRRNDGGYDDPHSASFRPSAARAGIQRALAARTCRPGSLSHGVDVPSRE